MTTFTATTAALVQYHQPAAGARKKRPDSLVAENVDLPPGDHRVTISIANTSGKDGVTDISVLGCPVGCRRWRPWHAPGKTRGVSLN